MKYSNDMATFAKQVIAHTDAMIAAMKTGNMVVIRAVAIATHTIQDTEDFTVEMNDDNACIDYVEDCINEAMEMVNNFHSILKKAPYYEIVNDEDEEMIYDEEYY